MDIALTSRTCTTIDVPADGLMATSPQTRASSPELVGGLPKRAFDICFALSAVIALSPLFIMIILALKAIDRGPALYRHRRVGAEGTTFDCLKFRTMRTDGDAVLKAFLQSDAVAAREWAETRKLKRDPRVTVIGAALRKTSLDELPQLFNILAGSMSVVGPRPIVSEEVERYGADAGHYFATRPGLTGAWQVSGRSDVGYAERVRLDRSYVDQWSFYRDISIILRTVPAVFMSRGSY